ncbi:DNA-binding transcriptional regulator, MerR family [Pseudomonas asturiensis]|uniref:DNA-binding transcriptional regulator, MerR family n=3 Tax=Pseudomonas TaxID=286 RepID=A0A1M7NUL9_9PSED|nr:MULTISPECIES: MerR family transcriptional regulator [Pseudomonas]MBC3957020.1 MerR family transcriptional regulator [Pseudomonas triticifolii]QHF01646.1 MerR family transcriptional regulator [Pseudomonas asturiensis]SHN07409.1 DNA-binding transcriptional regulator, MerR family [Pseudomonas asturiensis]
MRIGELAEATAVSRDTLRFYEQRGLIVAQRSANGYRHYPVETVQLVQFIKVAQRLGFSLNEVGSNVAELWKAPDPDTAIAALLREKLALIDTRIAALTALRGELHQRLGQQCPLSP